MKGLRTVRKAKGMKQSEVSRATGIKPSAYSHYENGVREPSLATLVKLSDFFGVSIHYLVTGEEFQAPEE